MLKNQIRIRYQKSLKKYGFCPRALKWRTQQAAEARYKNLIHDIDFKGKTVLDVGCGFADIIPLIKAKTGSFTYTGVDLVPEFIKFAKQKYPNFQFVERDYFGEPLDKMFDIIISSGTLNSNIKNPLEYRKRAIKTMFEHASKLLAFNMAGGHPQPKNIRGNRVYYIDSLEMLKFCLSLTPKIILRHHYRFNDFTIVMYKPDPACGGTSGRVCWQSGSFRQTCLGHGLGRTSARGLPRRAAASIGLHSRQRRDISG
ncbi:MAG: class I SAM-dependent methyltransferase [Candidatus Berkelbacteria bacterium]|nr:class I SAM-dependent methyltransferase [Candidatus Berkelbacteria bacterium]